MEMSGGVMEARVRYKQSASRLTIFTHLFGIVAFILMLVWLLHFRQGLQYDSDDPDRVFNVHPLLMFCGFIFLAGQSMMAYKTVMAASHGTQKSIHMALHLSALVLGVVGLCAVFKYHDMMNIKNLTTLHSWIGITTFTLFCLQWVVGVGTFLAPGALTTTRARLLPWHISGGRALLYMAICTALTGLLQKTTVMTLTTGLVPDSTEYHLINFLGLFILLFGIFVDLTVALARYV